MRHECLPSAAALAHAAKLARRLRRPARSGLDGLTRPAALIAALALGGCAPPPDDGPTARAMSTAISLPLADPVQGLSTAVPPARSPSNAALARDFMELSFYLESGRALPRFTRFEGPVTIRTTGAVPPNAGPDLAGLTARLRHEAGIDITIVSAADASISVEFVPKRQIQAQVPNAACFVVPNVSSWDDYKRSRRSGKSDWAQLQTRTRATVFVPSDAAPQEVRDCLHEEVSQALGPLNDLYRLPDTVWNDDNFHTILTGYDMTILRAYYAPELHSGLSGPEVFSRLPAVLARANPSGGAVTGADNPGDTPRAFVAALERALGAKANPTRRQAAAREAVQIATARGWHDTRAGFAWFALGRLSIKDAPKTAFNAFVQAGAIYRTIPGADIQAAHVDMQLAAFALANGRAQDAIALANRALGPAIEGENAALMATLHMIRAEAYQSLGNTAEARQARLDSASWARYGFGSDAAVRRRAAEVAALANSGARLN